MLWSDTRNVDTEGNALSPASRDWTELYIADREGSAIIVDVYEHSIDPLILAVESTSDYVAERVAWYLAIETTGDIAKSSNGEFKAPEFFTSSLGDGFNYEEALIRARASSYNDTTLNNPYPD